METDSLSCLPSIGASVPFTSPYVLFKIYLLNLDSLEFWQWLWNFTLHLFPSFVYMLMLYCFITIKHIELCNTVETACRLCSYLRWQSRILEKNLGPFSAADSAKEKKSPNGHFCVPAKSASNMNGIDSQLHFVWVKRSEVRKGSRGSQLCGVCGDCSLCTVKSIPHCLVLCLWWRFREISSHCK